MCNDTPPKKKTKQTNKLNTFGDILLKNKLLKKSERTWFALHVTLCFTGRSCGLLRQIKTFPFLKKEL